VSTTSQRTLTPAMSATRSANDVVAHPICYPTGTSGPVWGRRRSMTSCPATTIVSPSINLAGPASGTLAERHDNNKTGQRIESVSANSTTQPADQVCRSGTSNHRRGDVMAWQLKSLEGQAKMSAVMLTYQASASARVCARTSGLSPTSLMKLSTDAISSSVAL
jgi:hypothetical protein